MPGPGVGVPFLARRYTGRYSWQLSPDATGHFEVGTQAIGAGQVLAESLPYIRSLGVENIHAHRQPLLKKLRQEMPHLDFSL